MELLVVAVGSEVEVKLICKNISYCLEKKSVLDLQLVDWIFDTELTRSQ